MNILMVGLGGAVGAVLRYLISLLPYNGAFPLLTAITNITGAVFIGFIAGIAVSKNLSANTVLFLKTGVCGGYTTFSTFSLEAYNLFCGGNTFLAVLYLLLSVFGCLAGIWVGFALSRYVSR